MEKGIKVKGKVEKAVFLIARVLFFIKRVFFLVVFARVYRVGLKTSLFCRFWISSSCNLSV